MKKCPFCAEEIQDQAIKCKHCGEFLDGRAQEKVKVKEKLPFYFSTSFLIIGFFCVGPLILPVVWINPKYGAVTKIFITVITVFISYLLYKAFLSSYSELKEVYSLLPKV